VKLNYIIGNGPIPGTPLIYNIDPDNVASPISLDCHSLHPDAPCPILSAPSLRANPLNPSATPMALLMAHRQRPWSTCASTSPTASRPHLLLPTQIITTIALIYW